MDLLGHRQSEYAYYQDLFWVVTPLEDTDVVMELYSSVVPFIFFPPQEIYTLIIENIQMHDAYRYIPQLYADLQHSTIFRHQDFTELFVKQLSNRKFDPVLQGQMCDIATSMLTSWQESKHLLRDRQLYMDGSVLGHFMITFLNSDQPDKAWELFQLYQKDRSLQRLSDPSGESLSKMAEHLMTRKDYDSTKEVLDLMQNLNYAEVSPLVEKVLQTFELSDHERNYLKGLAVHLEPSSNTN
uniref:Uncharacterized protein n=1 Tax=Arion vulgaris TaxID=1028688 RepID=A0A0B7BIC1_9EUPU